MEQIVSFPGLGLEVNVDSVAFYLPEFLNSRPIYWYGVLIALGFLLAVLYIIKRAHVFGLDSDRAFDVTFVTIIAGIIGARVYYVVFSWDTYKDDLLSILRTDEGGLAIYGGIIFGAIGLIAACKVRGVRFWPMGDLTVGGVILAQAIGRWGNFFNQEAFGGNTSLPWGMTSPSVERYLSAHQTTLAEIGMIVDPTQPVHPTFLYESLWCLLGFFAILWITKRRKFDGQVTFFYFAWYGFGRMFIEGLRTDSLMIGSFRVSQLLALLCFVVSTVFIIVKLRKIKNSDNPDESRLYIDTEESKLILEGKFYKSKKDEEKDSTDQHQEEEAEKEDVVEENDQEDIEKSEPEQAEDE